LDLHIKGPRDESLHGRKMIVQKLNSRAFAGILRRTVRGFRKKLFFGFPKKIENRKPKSKK